MTPEQHREQAEILLRNVWARGGPDGDALIRTPQQRAEMLHAAQIHATIYASDTQRVLTGEVHQIGELAQSEVRQLAEAKVSPEHQRDLTAEQRNDARRIVEEARHAAEQILRFTREHPGHEFDLKPLLDALQIDPQAQP